jgi:hypothetical protein
MRGAGGEWRGSGEEDSGELLAACSVSAAGLDKVVVAAVTDEACGTCAIFVADVSARGLPTAVESKPSAGAVPAA